MCHDSLLLAFNQIIYESAADTGICKHASFVDVVSIAAYTSKKEHIYPLLPFSYSI